MSILETIHYILKAHDEAKIDARGIKWILQTRNITMPLYTIHNIINTLYHFHSINGILKYNVDWPMRGFRIIIEKYEAGETRDDIWNLLRTTGYEWSDG
ncbi:hypothetical protein MMC07_004710, partial [Pseudocyphellaria aurata]|nr:hypothetical protein [Pseudocyphellaria aurata]